MHLSYFSQVHNFKFSSVDLQYYFQIVGALIACFGFWLRFASPVREILESDITSLTVFYLSIIFGIFFILFGKFGFSI